MSICVSVSLSEHKARSQFLSLFMCVLLNYFPKIVNSAVTLELSQGYHLGCFTEKEFSL